MFRRQSWVLFFICFPPSLSPSLQLALRAPSSHSRGQDYVSNVRSTVAQPSRLPHFAVVGMAITAETWTNRRTCAPVSLSLCQTSTNSKDTVQTFSSVIVVSLRVIETCSQKQILGLEWRQITESPLSLH